MWYVVVKEKANVRAMTDFRALIEVWMKHHSAHKYAKAYAENLEGIRDDISKSSKFTQFIEVVSSHGVVGAVAKVSVTGGGVYLAEIVKHEEASSDALNALFGWAVYTAGPKNITLAAAYVGLISQYEKYGFALDVPNPSWKKMPSTTRINAPMTMTSPAKAGYLHDYREGIFWELLPDLVG